MMIQETCAYLLDDGTACAELAAPRRPYCPAHHEACHLAPGTVREMARLKEIEKLSAWRRGKWPLAWGPPPVDHARSYSRSRHGRA